MRVSIPTHAYRARLMAVLDHLVRLKYTFTMTCWGTHHRLLYTCDRMHTLHSVLFSSHCAPTSRTLYGGCRVGGAVLAFFLNCSDWRAATRTPPPPPPPTRSQQSATVWDWVLLRVLKLCHFYGLYLQESLSYLYMLDGGTGVTPLSQLPVNGLHEYSSSTGSGLNGLSQATSMSDSPLDLSPPCPSPLSGANLMSDCACIQCDEAR